ncbi:IS5 family transposase [Rhodanobacter sp. AS-Z3]|uniref:IS5 family transposase n=1 Tax=Rhodanobacter sp. AS-Z3 TaxID=3031330 RepID=UPI0024791B04|nr:IS5 family transposase [Rhodanobacter sp. AS-Z3]WEN13903.1 IS5 family transposase [Rhodanobacter sp. AS-Z3]WEN14043.1 IS5 family transposase [Rhodanobacter sp. AS-Z3]WEN14291.1 IS5 family transposase [Rhodanobacter sp. AS-Z3]WEN14372.1 IS5 family transposase [Rhodanobacter sp. AS-Z3]WEN15640.1 IS5 family transposase [Rhodanobacter sp. AS-Z3]
MKQRSFASLSFEVKKKPTRRERFLGEMDKVVPWADLLALIEPSYPTSGRRGRPPMAASTMLRIHFMQQWYALSDPAMEDALYEIESMRRFAGLELNEDAIPDESTILKFRRFLEQHGLAVKIFEAVNAHLSGQGLLLRQGTIVDATIIQAPSSTKNADKQRDPDMRQTKKGQQWYFGMKAHIGVDVESGLVHTVTTTPANVGDVTEVDKLLHGQEKTVHADAGYQGAEKRAPKRGRTWHIAAKRGSVKAMPEGELKDAVKHTEHMKAAVRAKVEHPFRVVKRQFGYQKVRFKGLLKNTAQILTLFALSNLWMVRRTLLASAGEVRL